MICLAVRKRNPQLFFHRLIQGMWHAIHPQSDCVPTSRKHSFE
jgi:hypothetical protein